MGVLDSPASLVLLASFTALNVRAVNGYGETRKLVSCLRHWTGSRIVTWLFA